MTAAHKLTTASPGETIELSRKAPLGEKVAWQVSDWEKPAANDCCIREKTEAKVRCPSGQGLYAYVENNPINFTDPTGLLRSGRNARNTTSNNTSGSATVGVGGSFQYGPGGASASTNIGVDSKGKVCMQFTKCAQVGFGMFGGVGVTGSASTSDFCEGTSTSEGVFGEGGSVLAGGGSVSSDGGISTGLAGVGKGAAAGKQFCTTRTICFN